MQDRGYDQSINCSFYCSNDQDISREKQSPATAIDKKADQKPHSDTDHDGHTVGLRQECVVELGTQIYSHTSQYKCWQEPTPFFRSSQEICDDKGQSGSGQIQNFVLLC